MNQIPVEYAQMRHMLVGRVVHQHVMLFEPAAWVRHLNALTDLVSRSVLVPAAVNAFTEHRPSTVATVRLAESAKLADGDWPEFSRTLTTHDVRGRAVVFGPEVPDESLTVLTDAVALLDTAGLGVFADLVLGALVGEVSDVPTDPRDGVLIRDRGAEGVDAQLAAVLSGIPRTWGSYDVDEWHAVRQALGSVRVEDVFVAGCVAEMADRLADFRERCPALVEQADDITCKITNAVHERVVELKRSSLLAELLLCWWPVGDRVVHLFTSELDYLTKLGPQLS